MSEGAAQPIYSVDTSSFMDWQARYYPTDVFRTLNERVSDLVAKGRVLAPALVREEIKAVGTDDLNRWAIANSGIFVPTADVLADAQAIQNQFVGLRDPKAEHEEADAYVIALAKQKGGIVVTQEPPPPKRRNLHEATSSPTFVVSWAFPASACWVLCAARVGSCNQALVRLRVSNTPRFTPNRLCFLM
ncbi:MAG: hypothetical protein USCGTAYLOR_00751 [Chromatiales bacterium USCg_Taylor]|nr:MAG: hypothetical protein USCGTAYLOR_00751 [Chromatiales bacterium USCg_Taylor]